MGSKAPNPAPRQPDGQFSANRPIEKGYNKPLSEGKNPPPTGAAGGGTSSPAPPPKK
jgi:hypothetical protein